MRHIISRLMDAVKSCLAAEGAACHGVERRALSTSFVIFSGVRSPAGGAKIVVLDNPCTHQYNRLHVAFTSHSGKETDPKTAAPENADVAPCVGGTPAHCANHSRI